MVTFDLIQWTGVFLVLFGALVGGIGMMLDGLLDVGSHVPDAFLAGARICCWAGVGLALVGMVFGHAS